MTDDWNLCKRCLGFIAADPPPYRAGSFVFCSARCRRIWLTGIKVEDDR